jgi:hypothetical protein
MESESGIKLTFNFTIVRTLFWTSAETLDFSLTKPLPKRPETLILPLTIENCPEC